MRRYERDRPGELLHVDVKKIGRLRNGGGWRSLGRDSIQHRRARTASSSARQRARVSSALIEKVLAYTKVVGTIIHMAEAVKPRGCTNHKLRQLSRAVTRHYDAYIAAAGLKNTQYSLLSHVVQLGPIRPSDLAQRMRLDASTLTRNLQPLLAQGWLRQGPGEDARSRLIEATEAGRAKRAEAQRAWKQAQLALNERLGDERVARLHDLLDRCLAALDAEDAATDA